MKITVTRYWDGDDDCNRYTYVTKVNGKEHCLAPCALSGGLVESEIEERARKLFGADVEIEWEI
jgi:hypothetical protein